MVIIFCLLLISGIIAGQVFDFSGMHDVLSLVTSFCLAYIMIEVGLEFSVDKRKIGSYGWDSVVAVIAAALPALLWFGYIYSKPVEACFVVRAFLRAHVRRRSFFNDDGRGFKRDMGI